MEVGHINGIETHYGCAWLDVRQETKVFVMNRWINAALSDHAVAVGLVVGCCVMGLSCSAGKQGDSNVIGNTPGTGSGGGGPTTGGPSGSGSSSGPKLGDIPTTGPAEACQGLACQVPACTGGAKTTISGKVYAPNGTLPLYNVLVYVPNPSVTPVMPFTEGVSCDRCGASVVNPVTSAVTDETGSFLLENAPAGADIPLVIQVGKWRRQLTIPAVTGCADNPLTDPQFTRLPRNSTEGDIPRLAISTGGADQMECLPLRMGIDPAEFTPATGGGRIHLFVGNSAENEQTFQPVRAMDASQGGMPLTSSNELWASADSLSTYDIVILSCESNSFAQEKPMAVREGMYEYASRGGRVFASHWHNIWFEDGPDPVPTTGTWSRREDPVGDNTPLPGTINQTFPKGAALAAWLMNVGASTALGTMNVIYPRDNIQAVNEEVAREWISVNNPEEGNTKAVQYMSFNTPIGAPEAEICGREVYTNLHVAAVTDTTQANALGFPASCGMQELTAQEKAVAFMLFDLSSCVQSETLPPKPPK
jgi:hypothetical protein